MLTSSRSEAAAQSGSVIPSGPTVSSWAAARGARYYIGHRGSGDVFPEHTMEAYRAAVSWGAPCLEISVGMTSDEVLICMHDSTYDRTTTWTGNIADQPSTVLRNIGVNPSYLGPAWSAIPRPVVPLFEDVLRTFGGRVILAIEAKNNAAYPAMMNLVEAYGLSDSVIVKVDHRSARLAEAKAAGYPVFGYIGSDTELTLAAVRTLAAKLDARNDCMVIPAYHADGYLADDLVDYAVATSIPVWVFPIHRRNDVTHFSALGVVGYVTSSFGYVSTRAPVATSDTWRSLAIAPGEMTKNPASAAYQPTWSEGGALTLDAKGTQHFLTLGHFGPLAQAQGTYRISLEASWASLPADPSNNITVAFGHVDDAYYEHRLGRGSGYHAIVRANGTIGLYAHADGSPDGLLLGEKSTAAPLAGGWMRFSLQVTPTTITWSRLDVPNASVVAQNSAYRGGYVHLGRASPDGVSSFRNLVVS